MVTGIALLGFGIRQPLERAQLLEAQSAPVDGSIDLDVQKIRRNLHRIDLRGSFTSRARVPSEVIYSVIDVFVAKDPDVKSALLPIVLNKPDEKGIVSWTRIARRVSVLGSYEGQMRSELERMFPGGTISVGGNGASYLQPGDEARFAESYFVELESDWLVGYVAHAQYKSATGGVVTTTMAGYVFEDR